jgi:hypothetical protein
MGLTWLQKSLRTGAAVGLSLIISSSCRFNVRAAGGECFSCRVMATSSWRRAAATTPTLDVGIDVIEEESRLGNAWLRKV